MNWQAFWITFVVVGLLATVGVIDEYDLSNGADVVALLIDGAVRFVFTGGLFGVAVGAVVGRFGRPSGGSPGKVAEVSALASEEAPAVASPPVAIPVVADTKSDDASTEGVKRILINRPAVRWSFLAALVVLSVLTADWLLQVWEMDRLLDQVEESEAAMGDWIADMDALFGGHVEEWGSGSWTDAQLEQYYGEVEEIAAAHAPAVINEADDVDGMFLLPWHRSIERAAHSYSDHGQAWSDSLRSLANDGEAIGDRSRSVDIAATFVIAADHFRSAIPPLDFQDLDARVEDIFDE